LRATLPAGTNGPKTQTIALSPWVARGAPNESLVSRPFRRNGRAANKIKTPLESSILDDEGDVAHLAPLLADTEIVVRHIWRAGFPPAPPRQPQRAPQ